MRQRTFMWFLLCAIMLTYAQTNLFAIFRVSSASMEPTISMGKLVFVNRMAIPQMGDILVVKVNGQLLVRRVVGLPGNLLTFGGQRFLVPKGSVFVVADNTKRSMDSRDFGAVDMKNVVGKVFGK